MQEEVENRAVTLVISTTKLTGRLLKAAILKYLASRKEKRLQKARAAPEKPTGKQTVAVQEADAACRAAIYVRLSVEDTHTHSVSIETQQMIIARYLEQYPEISVYDTYIDNGATGTNFAGVRYSDFF